MGSLSRGQMVCVFFSLKDPWQDQWGMVMALQSDLPRVTEMAMPSLPDIFLLGQLVLFSSIHPTDGDGFKEIRTVIGWLDLNDTGQEIHWTTGASNNNDRPPSSNVLLLLLLLPALFFLDSHGYHKIYKPVH